MDPERNRNYPICRLGPTFSSLPRERVLLAINELHETKGRLTPPLPEPEELQKNVYETSSFRLQILTKR